MRKERKLNYQSPLTPECTSCEGSLTEKNNSASGKTTLLPLLDIQGDYCMDTYRRDAE
jgi:hypothetical protein